MKRWKIELLVVAICAAAIWASPAWVAGWFVAVGLPVALVYLLWRTNALQGPRLVWGLLLTFAGMMAMSWVVFPSPEGRAWFRENVFPVYETLKDVLTGPTLSSLAGWLFGIFIYPGLWALGAVWERLLEIDGNPFDPVRPWSYPLMALVFVSSWVFWSVGISRSLYFVGLWDPFWRADFARPWVKQAWVRLREWWAEGWFGYGPGSRWASLVEVFARRYASGDVFLGRPKLRLGGLLRPIGIRTEKHMVTIAGTGSGKSTAALIPNLCVHEGSLLCIDPKGELAAITARRRGPGGHGVIGMGQRVCVLDPFGDVPGWTSASYNVFDEIAQVAARDPDAVVGFAGKLTEALVLNVSEHDPFWDTSSRDLLLGLILYVLSQEPPERRNLLRVRELLVQGDVEEYQRADAAGLLDANDTPFTLLLERMILCRDYPHYGHVIAGKAELIKRIPDRTIGSVLAAAATHTSFLDENKIRAISTRSDFLLADFKREPLSVYVCLPISRMKGLEGRWLRMFVVLFTDMMQTSSQGAPDPPVLLAIDEFPSLGRLSSIETVAPLLRSYGVRFWAVAQDFSQLKAVYPDCWDGFIGGAAAVQFLGITHPETVEYIVERLGKHIVYERVRGWDGRPRREKHERPLLDENQATLLLDPEKKNQIVWRGSARHMLLKMTPYFDYLPWWYYDADPRFPERFRRRFWRWLFSVGERGREEAVPTAASVVGDESEAGAGAGTAPVNEEERTPSWADVIEESEASSPTTKPPPPAK